MNGRIVERNKHLHRVEVITTTWLPTHQFLMISRKYQVTLKGTTLELVIQYFYHYEYKPCIHSDKSNKTISDGGITVDFWFIKVHTSN